MEGEKEISYRRLHIIADTIEGEDIEDRIYNNGDMLFKEGTSSKGLFFIERGTILLTTRCSNGSDVVIRSTGANDFIGFLSLVRETKYASTAIAMEDKCRVRFISKVIFQEALADNRFANGFISILCDRIKSIENHIVNIKTKSARQRLATVLISFENAFKKRGSKERPVITLKKKDIAGVVGITPETLSRRLSEFESEGFIELHIKGIKVKNHQQLLMISNISD